MKPPVWNVSPYLTEAPELWRGMVGCWAFWENASPIISDVTTNGNDGVMQNMDPTTDWVLSTDGLAVDFDGSNDYIDCGKGSSMNNAVFSVRMIINSKVAVGNSIEQPIRKHTIDSQSEAQFSFAWGHNNSNFQQAWAIKNTSNEFFAAQYTTSLQANIWYDMVATFDGSYLRAYLDGVLENTGTITGTIKTGNSSLYLGSGRQQGGSADNQFNGYMMLCQLWNRVLRNDEISILSATNKLAELRPRMS